MFSRLAHLDHPAESLTTKQLVALKTFQSKITNGIYSLEDAQCLCGAKRGLIVAKVDRYALSVQTNLCKDCGIMWTSPRLNKKSLSEFYKNDYRPIYVGDAAAPEKFYHDQVLHGRNIVSYLSEKLKVEEVNRVFDIGCGAGGVLLPFKERGCVVFGCDMGSEYLSRGRNDGLVLEEGDCTSLAKYGPANLIILSHVLEHFPDPLKSLTQISNLLEDEGYIYIEVPGILNAYQTYGDIILYLQNAHLYHFTLRSLEVLMTIVGFELVCGNEGVKALFRKTREGRAGGRKLSVYREVFSYLWYHELLTLFGLPHSRPSTRAILNPRTILNRVATIILGASAYEKLKGQIRESRRRRIFVEKKHKDNSKHQ